MRRLNSYTGTEETERDRLEKAFDDAQAAVDDKEPIFAAAQNDYRQLEADFKADEKERNDAKLAKEKEERKVVTDALKVAKDLFKEW